MERAQGESLKELAEILKQIVEVENRLFSARFAKYGSLYYKEDLEEI